MSSTIGGAWRSGGAETPWGRIPERLPIRSGTIGFLTQCFGVCVPAESSQRIKHTVRRAVCISLLVGVSAFFPAPLRAADPAPDYLAAFEACPEGIVPAAGFADIPSGHPNAGDIDCIAYYGITKGTSSTTYSPDRPVIREHLALFLVRLARLVGIRVPAEADTPFEDIAHLRPKSREAISQIHQLKITNGVEATRFAPGRLVTRAEIALALQRLMDLMAPVADGRRVFGYTPDDVDDNDRRLEVESPFEDLEEVPHMVHEAVTQLYELGVASGLSHLVYGPSENMSRADMAGFMAAILDHSNLRPEGMVMQVSPAVGTDGFEVAMMVSLRDDGFAPTGEVAVDWFYSDHADGGLERDGTCDRSRILGGGDCVWDGDEDETTDLNGNLFGYLDATPGETMTVYAWIGGRDGQRFDRDSSRFIEARARSEKGARSLLVRHDVPANAARVGRNGAFLVDMDRRSSVEFTIELLDGDGTRLEREGVPIGIEVESRQVRVEASEVSGGRPDPDLVRIGGRTREETTVTTDRSGTATFDLKGPVREERLDIVTIESDCCADQIHQIAWSHGHPVLVSARPDFDLYQSRDGDRIAFTVEYSLYDQYGGILRGTAPRYTGRPDTDLSATLGYRLYHAPSPGGDGVYTVRETSGAGGTSTITINRRSVTAAIEIEIPSALRDGHEFLVTLDARIFSDADGDRSLDSNEVRYVDSDETVWIVKEARSREDYVQLLDRSLTGPSGLDLKQVELYPENGRYRTFFTLWTYDERHRFQSDGKFVSLERFEELWKQKVNGIDDLDILIYATGFSLIVIK